MQWLFTRRMIFAIFIASLFLFETPRNKLVELGDSLLTRLQEHNKQNALGSLPATIQPDALMLGDRGFVTAEGFQFSVSRSIRHWRNQDNLTWSHASGGKILVTNTRTGETLTATLIQKRREAHYSRGY